MDLHLTNKVAIITGSSRGLGLASATALALEGASVTICGRSPEGLRAAHASIADATGHPEKVESVVCDVGTVEGPSLLVGRAIERFGGVDILVNNVGLGRGAGLMDTPDATWQEAFDCTLYPALRASRAVVPLMRARGGGVILFVASIWGRESGGRMTYNAVKAAEISLSKALARELAPDGIRVNAVAPGSILFPGGSWHQRQLADPEGIAEFVKRDLPFGRFGTAEEVGSVVAFLASSRASWISGACIPVDGCQGRSNI
jgi:3-oxoacyl-[acyl-carrier protein] reductase